MCTTNSDCQQGFRCDTGTGQCVPSNSSGDPIKPTKPPEATATVTKVKKKVKK